MNINYHSLLQTAETHLQNASIFIQPYYEDSKEQLGRLKANTIFFIKDIPNQVKDPKVGHASIVAVTLMTYQISLFTAPYFSKLLQKMTIDEDLSNTLSYTACGIFLIGVPSVAFYDWAKPAVDLKVACALAVMTLFLRSMHVLFQPLPGNPG